MLLSLHESWVNFIFNQFNQTVTLYQVHSSFLKLFEINVFSFHSSQPSSLRLEHMDLPSHFCSANYMFFIRRRNNFE